MRTDRNVAALSLAILLGACDRPRESAAKLSPDLEKDLAAASAAGGGLATAPASYQRVRFVSDVERWKASAPSPKHATSKHPMRAAPSRQMAAMPEMETSPQPAPSTATEDAPPAAVAQAAASEPAPYIEEGPPRGQTSAPGTAGADNGSAERGRGGGWGGLLGGIIGSVVIRGGHGGVDHCDPRTDGRARPPVINQPVFGDPVVGGGIFTGGRRR